MALSLRSWCEFGVLSFAYSTPYWNNFHEIMRRKGSKRPALTEAQRRERPPVSHPVFLTHPIRGRKVIYVIPGFTVGIDGFEPDASREMLDFLFALGTTAGLHTPASA